MLEPSPAHARRSGRILVPLIATAIVGTALGFAAGEFLRSSSRTTVHAADRAVTVTPLLATDGPAIAAASGPSAAERVADGASSASMPARTAIALDGPATPTAELLARLRQRLALPSVDARYHGDSTGLLALAIDVYVALDGPAAAAALLGPDAPLDLIRKVARAFPGKGPDAAAAAVWHMALERQRDEFLAASIGVRSGHNPWDGGTIEWQMPEGMDFEQLAALGYLDADESRMAFAMSGRTGANAAEPTFDRQQTLNDLNEYAKRDRDGALALLAVWRELAPPGARRAIDLLYVQHLQQAQRRTEAAQVLFDMAMASPDDTALAVQLAGLDAARAEPLLRRLVALGDNRAALQGLIGALGRMGRAGEALDLLTASLPSDATPAQREAALGAHSIQTATMDPDALVQWLGGYPTSYPVATPVIQGYANAGRLDAALEVYAGALRAVESDPNAWALPDLPPELFQSRRSDVERLLDAAARSTTANDEILGDIGDAYARLGRHEDALRMYERAKAIDPGDGEWTSSIARMQGLLRNR